MYNLDDLWDRIAARSANSYQEAYDRHWLQVLLAFAIELRGLRIVLGNPTYTVGPEGKITTRIVESQPRGSL